MSKTEITNAQYNAYDPEHDTRYIEHGKDHIVPSYIANHPDQPVARELGRSAGFVQWLRDEETLTPRFRSAMGMGARKLRGRIYFGPFEADFSANSPTRIWRLTRENGATIHAP